MQIYRTLHVNLFRCSHFIDVYIESLSSAFAFALCSVFFFYISRSDFFFSIITVLCLVATFCEQISPFFHILIAKFFVVPTSQRPNVFRITYHQDKRNSTNVGSNKKYSRKRKIFQQFPILRHIERILS